MISEDLHAAVLQLARAPQLLVACDYDGTLAPLVDDPMSALPERDSVVALRGLAELDQTQAAVISGRSLRDLAALSRLPSEVHLVGSHGGEFDVDFAHQLDEATVALRQKLGEAVDEIAAEFPGVTVEKKPASFAVHVRRLDAEAGAAAMAAIASGPGSWDGVTPREGKQVCELLLHQTNKGEALDTIRRRVSASAVLFIGDDRTDEDAFERLRGPDVGVKIGSGDTLAHYRVDDIESVAMLLAGVLEARRLWLAGEGLTPIEAHSILSDLRTAAIVTPSARISWLCFPRLDSAAVFAELVGGPSAGYFAVASTDGDGPTGQRYVGDTMVLETAWEHFTVVDYLDVSGSRTTQTAGRSDLIRVVEGTGSVVVEFAPRLDFGRFRTQLAVKDDGLEVVGSTDLIVLRAPGVHWELLEDGQHQTARAVIDLDAGAICFELRCGTGSLRPSVKPELEHRRETVDFWTQWARSLTVPAEAAQLVRRSALVLKALVHGPSGAIAAAATTSLPESIGGIRNWDYRYCWLRDAALSAATLVRLGSSAEAMNFLDWVLALIDHIDPDRLAPLYTVTGQKLPPEAEIGSLAGYGGSRPVRIGNAADHQVQLDVFGPIVDLVHELGVHGAPLSTRHWRLVEAMVHAVEARWEEPDNGIWEIRKAPRHHVYTKTMCWVTVDRAIAIAEEFFGQQRPWWAELRDRIHAEIIAEGWSDEADSFTAAYDGTDLDASVLAVGLWGVVDADDDRFARTVRAVEKELRDGATVYRYLHDDGLPGDEGGFNLMTSWLIDAYHLVGEHAEAQNLFRKLVALAGRTGMMAEEYDPATHRALGNVPQAYSHLGIVNNALTLRG